jgi:hypothetical protein
MLTFYSHGLRFNEKLQWYFFFNLLSFGRSLKHKNTKYRFSASWELNTKTKDYVGNPHKSSKQREIMYCQHVDMHPTWHSALD